MRSPIVTTPSPPEPTIAIVRSFVGIETLTFLPGARVSARSGHSVRQYERTAHDANAPADLSLRGNSAASESARSTEGEAAGEVVREAGMGVFAALGVKDVARVEGAPGDRFESLGEPVDVLEGVAQAEARADRAGNRRPVAGENALLDSPPLFLRDAQDRLDVGVRAEAAVARSNAPFERQDGGGQRVRHAGDVEGNHSQPGAGVGRIGVAVDRDAGDRGQALERGGGQLRLVSDDLLPPHLSPRPARPGRGQWEPSRARD